MNQYYNYNDPRQQPAEMQLNSEALSNLNTAARWAKILAIMYFIYAGLMICFGILMPLFFSNLYSYSDFYDYGVFEAITGLMSVIMVFSMLFPAALYFFYGFFAIRFSTRTKRAFETNDPVMLASGIRSMKGFWIYSGVITIIGVVTMFFALLGIALAAMVGANLGEYMLL